MQDGFVALDPLTQGYTLGPRILLLAGTMNSYRDLSDAVRPILVRLGDNTRTTIHLSEEREYEAVCIERYQPEKATVVFPHWNVGGRTMLNSGAAPWLLMAGMSDERVEKMLSDPSLRKLLSAPAVATQIRERLVQLRGREWTLSVDEVADGLTALAVPIRNLSGRTVAAISLVGLTPEMLVDGEPRYLSQALEAAREANSLVTSITPTETSRSR
jgi:DNA-binding IclR family transcriptional regulator